MHEFVRGLAVMAAGALLAACTTADPAGWPAMPGDGGAAAARFERLKAERPAELSAFLRAMPKGGDLHNHLSGTVYAENFIAWAIADGRCLVVAEQAIAPAPCDAKAGRPALAEAVESADAYNRLIDALSTRNYALREVSGHDQFFETFARFGAAEAGRDGDMLAEAMVRAADQNIGYLELMLSPGMAAARALGARVGWDDDLARFRGRLEAAGLPAVVSGARDEFTAMETRAREILDCAGSRPPACDVTVRYLAQVIRVFPREQVFAQTALAFALVAADPRIVGLNFVAPEDDRTALGDYSLHMRMIAALAAGTPGVPVTLHAGELALGLVPPEDLRFHVREAVEVAGARRIGHGVDLLHEDRPYDLLRRMADGGIAVEINLTSNDVILGIVGDEHPFETYRAHGVPLTLSTDDEGVSRIDLTHEYVRAVRTYDLGYGDVKALSRNALTYAFLPGVSLWADPAAARPLGACMRDDLGDPKPSQPCAAVLARSEKARAQWRLEAAFEVFEAEQAKLAP
ncbi:adenosine deaminase [Thalassobaculum sp.]|uniref:adenosine deaminase family protein n=1 Tax=Thalassobaculum sp. TaxID=2022740 RepID=UPI0032EEDFD3